MVFYTQFSSDATPVEQKKLWNPIKTLGLINPDPGYQRITCIGYAPSQGRRCRNPINASNREFIMATLNEIAYMHPDSSTVASRLREIVGPALCLAYHQNQSGTVLGQWQEDIKRVKPRLGQRMHTKLGPSIKKQETDPDQALKDAKKQLREVKKLLAEMHEQLMMQRHEGYGYERREEREAKIRQEEDRKRQEQERREREEKDREAKRQEEERKEKERKEELERLKKEQQEKAQKEKEEQEKARKEKEQQEKARREKEQQEKARKEKEQQEREQKAQEQKAQNERIRQRAQKIREERERKEREKAEKERAEWDQSWATYQERWVEFRSSTPQEGNLLNTVPWPVKSGSARDVCASAVEAFMEKAVPQGVNVTKLMRKECLKWHPDMIGNWLGEAKLSAAEQIMVDMICRVVTGVLDRAARRSSELLD